MEGRILTFVVMYTAGIFYGTYRSIKNPYPIHKIKWA
jgi:hypothetical protein